MWAVDQPKGTSADMNNFTPLGNSTVLAANTTSGNARVAISSGSVQGAGQWMIDNLDTANTVIVNIGYANTIQANQGTVGSASTALGFAIDAYASKFVTLPGSEFNNDPAANVFVVANAISGTANVMFTPVYIQN